MAHPDLLMPHHAPPPRITRLHGAQIAAPSSTTEITGLILAGGQGQRMGGADKGLQCYQGRPLVEHVLARLAPQVGTLLISANRNLDTYAAQGHPVLPDSLPDYPGPLAGLLAGLEACPTPWLLSAPCDTPGLPLDLATRLTAGIGAHALAYPTVDGRAHPVFCLCHRSLAPHLRALIENGQRKVMIWCEDAGAIAVPFDDQPEAFRNLNHVADLQTDLQADLDKGTEAGTEAKPMTASRPA